MTEKSAPDEAHTEPTLKDLASSTGAHSIQPPNEIQDPTVSEVETEESDKPKLQKSKSLVSLSNHC